MDDLIVLTGSALVAGDDFFAFLERGLIPPWLPEARTQNEIVIEATAATIRQRMATGSLVSPAGAQ